MPIVGTVGPEVLHLADWLEYLQTIEQRAETTRANYARLIRRLGVHLAKGADVWDPVTADRAAIEGHLKRLFHGGLGPAGLRSTITAVRNFYAWLAAHGWLDRSPMVGVKGPRAYRSEIDVLTPAEVALLIWGPDERRRMPADVMEARTRVILAVAYAAALRASEVGPLRLDDIEWEPGPGGAPCCSILVREGKWADSDQRIPLPLWASQLVGYWIGRRKELGPWAKAPHLFPGCSPSKLGLLRWAIARFMEQRCKAVGLKERGRLRLSPHVLRHSRAQHLLDLGWDIKTVQAYLRHRSITSTERYLRTGHRKMVKLLGRAEPLDPRVKRAKEVPHLGDALRSFAADLAGLGAPADSDSRNKGLGRY